MQAKKNLISIFFLITFGIILFPKDFVHDWTGHHDTEDINSNADSPVGIEKAHKHCDFLKLTAPDFCNTDKHILVSFPCVYNLFQEKSDFLFFLEKHSVHLHRGPPTIVC